MHAPVDKAERQALATLSAIKTYVMQKFFSAHGVAAGLKKSLRRTEKEIEADLKWLIEHGYIERINLSSKLFVTYKGWQLDK